jgi:Rieske Fe-S protein
MERRKFLKSSGLILVGATGVGQFIASCSKDKTCPTKTGGGENQYTIDLTNATNQTLTEVNGALKFDDVPGYTLPIIVIRISDTEAVAFSSRCTHVGCEIDLPVNNVMVCPGPCGHGSQFNISGEVINGIANNSLEEITAIIEGEQIILHLGS